MQLDRLEERFDLVILDRCLQFLPDPAAGVGVARSTLAPGGWLVVTGLAIWRRGEQARARLAAEQAAFRERFGMDLLLVPSKGLIEASDLAALDGAGLATRPYPALHLANLRARLDGSRPEHRYGLARSTEVA